LGNRSNTSYFSAIKKDGVRYMAPELEKALKLRAENNIHEFGLLE
jgi:hypothetical protein